MPKNEKKVNTPRIDAPPSSLIDDAISADVALKGVGSIDDEALKKLGVEIPEEPVIENIPEGGSDAKGKPRPFVKPEESGDSEHFGIKKSNGRRAKKAKAALEAAAMEKIAERPAARPGGLSDEFTRPPEVYDQKPPETPLLIIPETPPPQKELSVKKTSYDPMYFEYDPERTEATLAAYEAQSRRRAKNRRQRRIVGIAVLIILLLFVLLFAVGAIIQNNGGFTVNLTPGDKEKGLSLYSASDLSNGSSRLHANSIEDCADTTYKDISAQFYNIDNIDGSHNTDIYFAYTFYVANRGAGIVDYSIQLNILSTAKNVDGAIRIAIIEDSTYYGAADNVRQATIYAKPEDLSEHPERMVNQNGTAVLVDELNRPLAEQDNATQFYSEAVPYYKVFNNFLNTAPNNLHKYTVIVYLEGGDLDCANHIKGGEIKFNMELKVLDYRV